MIRKLLPDFIKNPQVYSFLIGLFTSNIATEITAVALPLIAINTLEATDQQIVFLGVLESFIMILLLLPSGLLIDSVNRRLILVNANVATAAFLLTVPLLYISGNLSFTWIVILMMSIRIVGACFDNASFTVMPRLVSDRFLDKANGAYGSIRSVAELSGAGIGTIALNTFGLVYLIIGNVLISIISVVFLWRLPKKCLDPLNHETKNLSENKSDTPHPLLAMVKRSFREATAGLLIITHNNRLLRIVGSSVTSNMFATLLGVTEIVYLVRFLEVPVWAVGILFSVPALGGIVGGLLVGLFSRTFGSVRMILVTQLVISAPILLMPLATPGWGISLYILSWFFYSLSSVIYGASVASMTQRIISDGYRGRVSAAGSWLNAIAVTLAGSVAAIMVDSVGTQILVFIGVLGVYGSAVWLIHPMFYIRTLGDENKV